MTVLTLSPAMTDKDNTKWKEQFNMKTLKSRNDLSSNPLFTSGRYDQTIALIVNAKPKCYGDRNK